MIFRRITVSLVNYPEQSKERRRIIRIVRISAMSETERFDNDFFSTTSSMTDKRSGGMMVRNLRRIVPVEVVYGYI